MRVHANLSALKATKPHEYAVRFLLGGLITVCAGLIAKRFGPGVGGLFLAFPAIFPASATLIEKHEKQRKGSAGFDGTMRGRTAAALDATGAAIGCVGLIVFGLVIWLTLPRYPSTVVLSTAAVLWFLVSATLWHSRVLLHRRKRSPTQSQGIELPAKSRIPRPKNAGSPQGG